MLYALDQVAGFLSFFFKLLNDRIGRISVQSNLFAYERGAYRHHDEDRREPENYYALQLHSFLAFQASNTRA